MKKIATTLLILTTFLLQGMAQVKFLDIYQRDRIAQTFATTDVDSISVTGSGNFREVNFFRGTDLVNSYRVSVIDSIKFFRSNEEPPVYMSIVGFNQDLYTKPVDVLSTSTASQFKSFINNLTTKDGRMLYYAVDSALDMLESYNFPTPLGSVNVITFFDGLDQGSLMMNPSYSTETQYLNAINERISSMKVRNLPLTAYSIGMRVNDAVDNGLFQNNLKSLATGSDKAEEVSSMSAVHTRLQEIADRIVCASTKQNITVRIPGTSNGTQVCFTFDGETPANSSMYIMGTFNLSDCSLHDVTCHGIIGENATVQGTRDGIFVTYTFTGLQREDGNGSVPVSNIRQYYKAGTSSKWQVNPEFSSDNTQTATTHTGSVILLVLDCSKALGTQFGNLQSYVDDFIQHVADNMASFSLSAPDNVKAELALRDDDFCINVCWNAVRNAEHYEIYRSDNSTGTFTKVAEDVTGTFWIDESPLSGDNYYKVLAVGHGLTSDESRVTEAVNYTLAAPENVVASLDDELFTVNITWDAVDFAESYNVYRSSNSDGEFSLVSMAVAGTSWSDPAPMSGTNYYKVEATGHGLTSQQSTVSNKINYALSSPSNVQAALDDEDFVINVTWDAVQYAESYIIYRSDSRMGTFTKIAENIMGTFWSDECPLQGSNYYKVVAVGHGLTSAYSNASNAADNAIAAPTNVKAVLDEVSLSVIVSWETSTHAESYNIYRSSNSNGNYTLVAMAIVSTEWKDDAPLQGSNYYKVYALGHDMTSPASATTNMVKVNYIPDAPQNVEAVLDDGHFTINVSWDAVSCVDSYTVYRSNSKTGAFTEIAENVTTNSWTDNTPLAGENYYQVCAFRRGYTSEVSNTTNVVNYVLSAPANATAVSDDDDFVVRVTWDAVPHAERYSITRSNSSSGTFTKVAEDIMTTTWTDASPLPGNNCYRVYAYGYGLVSPASNTTQVVDYALSVPANVIAVLDEDNSVVDISWNSVNHAECYEIYRSKSSTGDFEKVAEGITSTSWTDEHPQYSNYYRICAVCNDLTSNMSDISERIVIPTLFDGKVTVNGVSFKMIMVAGGTFQMGKSAGGGDVPPVHDVTLSDYYIGETEVTQELWKAVMRSNPSNFNGPQKPVEQVSWGDCQKFITKLNELTGLDFRLPTEAEWEFAAKGGTKSKGYLYSGSNTIDDVAWCYGNSRMTNEVAKKAPNELGIYDMSGNVWEWCQDWHGIYSSEAQTNPTGPSSGSFHIFRGGGWFYSAERCRTVFRYGYNPSLCAGSVGLRLVL